MAPYSFHWHTPELWFYMNSVWQSKQKASRWWIESKHTHSTYTGFNATFSSHQTRLHPFFMISFAFFSLYRFTFSRYFAPSLSAISFHENFMIWRKCFVQFELDHEEQFYHQTCFPIRKSFYWSICWAFLWFYSIRIMKMMVSLTMKCL